MSDDRLPRDRATALILREQHLTLATADAAGRPWVSPVFYAVDDEHRLYWVSDREALHSANIRERPDVAVVIHGTLDGRLDAVYLRARAEELDRLEDVELGMRVMATRPLSDTWTIHDIAEVTGEGPWRIYRATREATQVRGRAVKGGRAVAVRVDADG